MLLKFGSLEWYINFLPILHFILTEPIAFVYACIFSVNSLYVLLSFQVPPVKEIRKLMRIHALRCHVIYCQNGRKINVIPVLASRSQALRYIFCIYLFISFVP